MTSLQMPTALWRDKPHQQQQHRRTRIGEVVNDDDDDQDEIDMHSVAAGSELSALTFDEPKIAKDTNLRTMPLGWYAVVELHGKHV